MIPLPDIREKLEAIYARYNRKEFIHPDPLEYLYGYDDPEDMEIAGLIASSLAYGRVSQILKSTERVLAILGKSPASYIRKNTRKHFTGKLHGFKHRFTTGKDMALLLSGIQAVLGRYGSLHECFTSGYSGSDPDYLKAAGHFARTLGSAFPESGSYLIPAPERGSACKRLMLFLKWMIRHDEVDPGCWNELPPSKLIIPLDTHMYKIGIMTGATARKSADMKTALEITGFFSKINPGDPVRYDFALTRFGIRTELEIDDIWKE